MVGMIAELRPGDAHEFDELRKENALLWQANTHLQQELAVQSKEVVYLRNQLDFHRDWRKQADRVETEVLTAGEKATVAAIYGMISSGDISPNADGYYPVEPWRAAEKSGQSVGTVRGHINYVSDVHEDGKPDKVAAVPLFDKRLVKIPDERHEGEFIEATYLKPLAHLAYPLDYRAVARQLHNIGGAGRGQGRKPKCEKCGSDLQEKVRATHQQRSTYCPGCGTDHIYPVEQIAEVWPPTDDFPPGDSENQLDYQGSEETSEHNQPDTVNTKEEHNQLDYQGEEGDQVEEDPITPPIVSLEEWLSRRIGEGQTIWSTGDVEQVKGPKYYSHPLGHQLDIQGYLAGDRDCIYGSPLRLKDGKTWVLSFDIDKTEQALLKFDYLRMLAQAGIYAVYWSRRPGRAHLEMYFSEEVDINAAYAWVISVCPQLGEIEECYPYSGKFNGRVSWPLYHRLKAFDEQGRLISDQVHECAAIAMLPGADKPVHCAGIKSDPEGLRAIVAQAVTKASLIPELIVTQAADEAPAPGGVLLDTRSPQAFAGNSDGLGKAAIAEFNDTHTWEEIAALCGGFCRDRFRSPAHKEDTPSVVIRGNYASDYGRTPSGRVETRDKFGWWCLAKGINQDEELKRRIASKQV